MIKEEDNGRRSADGIYDRELTHRTANLLQQAIAALHLASRGDRSHAAAAIERITGAAELQRLLGSTGSEQAELTAYLAAICSALTKMHGAENAIELRLDSSRVGAGEKFTRCVGMIVAELVGNAIRHAFQARGGRITVTMRDDGDHGALIVEDNGVGGGWTRAGGQGHGIIDALARDLSGTVQRSRTPEGLSRVEIRGLILDQSVRQPMTAV